MANAQQFPAREKNVSDDFSMMLNGEQNKQTKKRPNLSMFVSLNGIKIKTYSADDEDWENATKGYVGINYVEMMMILHLIEEAIAAKEETTYKYEISDFTFFNKQRSEKPKLLWTVVVGQDAEGLIYITLLSSDNAKPKIPYYFGTRYLRNLVRTRGGDLTPARVSQINAKAWVDAERAIVPLALQQQWPAHLVNEQRKKDEKKEKGGGDKHSGGNNSGSSKSSDYTHDDVEDDLPF